MTDKKIQDIALMKIEMKLALDRFKEIYKKTSKGIIKIYTDAVLSNDYAEVSRLYARFFGYILKSKRAKELREDD